MLQYLIALASDMLAEQVNTHLILETQVLTMHYNTIFQVLAIFTLFAQAAATAVIVSPRSSSCLGEGDECYSDDECCSKPYLIFQVVFVLTLFYDFQVT